jgi:protein SCO1
VSSRHDENDMLPARARRESAAWRRTRAALGSPAAGVLLALCVLLGLAGCGGSGGEAVVRSPGGMVYQATPDADGFRGVGLPRPYRVPDVTLTDTSGAPYNLVDDTTKPVTLVFFGYSSCPDVCSLVMADIAAAMTQLDPKVAAEVQPLFVTTDPERDTPDVIRTYIDRFHPAFEGLTGPLGKIKAAAEPLGVPITGTRRLPSGGYEVGHGSQIIGVTADDQAHVVWTQGTPVDDLVADIHALVERQG